MYELSVDIIVVSSCSSIGRGGNGYWSVKVCFKMYSIVLGMLYIISFNVGMSILYVCSGYFYSCIY